MTILNGPLSKREGQRATLAVRTLPGAVCNVVLGYKPAPHLPTATADEQGMVSWTWTVFAPKGTWPISVTCGGASAATEITIS